MMKKSLLLSAFVLLTGGALLAQKAYTFKQPFPEHKAVQKMMVGIEPVKEGNMAQPRPVDLTPFMPQYKNTNVVTVIDLGTSANAYGYGYAGGQKSLVAAVPELNIVTNFHRLGGAAGGTGNQLGYDISLNGGQTFTNQIQIYNPAGATENPRYPQHGLYNPEGNTDINNVWIQYFAPTLDGSNGGSWGGYGFGVGKVADPNVKTKHNQTSTPPAIYQYIPDAYDITRQGKVFVVDVNQDWTSGSVVYQGSLLINKGIWDATDNDFVFTQELLPAPVVEATTRPADVKVAFSEDGMTGYISMLGDNNSVNVISNSPGYYPIIFKTTDGGETWSDGVGIQLGGPTGLPGIVNELLSDDQIAELYNPPLPARTEIPYTTAFDHDIVVDANGNLHIAVVVGVVGSNDYSIVSSDYLFAAYDIYTTDGGTTWHAVKLGNIRKFRGTWPDDYTEDNRIQISASPDRNTIFVLWLDTDLEAAEDNTRPNIFARGIRPNAWGTADLTCENGQPVATNVTLFSAGMWQASFHAVSAKSLFADNKYTIPIAYQPIDPSTNPVDPVQFKYITNFFYTDNDFCVVGNNEIAAIEALQVSQNFPNPFSGNTHVNITLARGSQVKLDVYNLTGQKVLSQNYGYRPGGQHTLQLNADQLPTGVYFYTVEANSQKITRKMVVR
ncbi:MAG: T9SS type A sorting domain-containing protein [Bacteroidetes bacterium]|nr:T9SS type A sorting domain-containing protein [Bacteroidota bacterium]